MADDNYRFEDISQLPSFARYRISFLGVVHSPHDPEDTIQLALTRKELAMVLFGTQLVNALFPELVLVSRVLQNKVEEVGVAQEFMAPPSKEEDL
jgi:hypothetical protein